MKRAIFFTYYLLLVISLVAGNLMVPDGPIEMTGFKIVVLSTAVICWYWFPLMVAFHRDTTNATFVGIVNMLAGWTGIGWFVALFFAVIGRKH